MAATDRQERKTDMDRTNQERVQEGWDRTAEGDVSLAFEMLADDVVVENGPGAGPWRLVERKEGLAAMYLGFITHFSAFRQDGRCIYADDDKAVSLVHETGVGVGGAVFDNRAIYVMRFREDGKIDRVWTVDLDTEAMLRFWAPRGDPADVEEMVAP